MSSHLPLTSVGYVAALVAADWYLVAAARHVRSLTELSRQVSSLATGGLANKGRYMDPQ